MGNLFVVGFDEPNQAEGVHFKLQKLQSEGLVDLADMAVAVKDETGKAKLHHVGNLLAEGAAFPSFCGPLANLIFLNATGVRQRRPLQPVVTHCASHPVILVSSCSRHSSPPRGHRRGSRLLTLYLACTPLDQ